MISVSQAEQIHKILIDSFGGSHRTRDSGALASALLRPFQTFDGKELYSSANEKAAALIESILINHPFIDGNKRIGYVLLRVFLLENNFDITATEDEKYNFIISIASGELKFEQILMWLEKNTTEITSKEIL